MLLPLLVPWFKVNQVLRLLLIDLRFQPLCWITLSSSNPRPGWSQLQQIEPEIFPSISLNPLLDWWRLPLLNHLRSAENWWRIRPKTPKHKPVLEDKTLKVLFKKKPVASFNPNRIPQSRLRTLSPLTNHKALQKWLCVIDVLWDVEDEDEESWTPISLFLVLCTLESILSNVGWYK